MGEERDRRNQLAKLNFLYKKISVPFPCMRYWLTIPEFVEALLLKVQNSETIDDSVVYEVMGKLFHDMESKKVSDSGERYNLRLARRALIKLEEALGVSQ